MIGCANWIITLGRFHIAHSINLLSRFSRAPCEGHLDALKRVFGHSMRFFKGPIMIDPKCPDHHQFDAHAHEQWKAFYPDAEEFLLAKDMTPDDCSQRCF